MRGVHSTAMSDEQVKKAKKKIQKGNIFELLHVMSFSIGTLGERLNEIKKDLEYLKDMRVIRK